MKNRLIVGMSGASGAPVTVELLRQLRFYSDQIEIHLVMTRGAELTLAEETNLSIADLSALADLTYDNSDIGAAIASGTFRTMGMIVAPCSMKTLSGIVCGYSENLLLRAADVTLKERRKLVLMPREAPLGTIHLRNLYEASRFGAVIIPPVLSFYNHPKTVDDCIKHIVGKILDQFDLKGDGFRRWR